MASSQTCPRHRIVCRSAEESEEVMRRNGVDQRVRQTGPGRFRYDLTIVANGDTNLFAESFRTGSSVQTEAPAGSAGLLFATGQGMPPRAVGSEWCADTLLFLPEGSGADIVSGGPLAGESILLPSARLTDIAETLAETPGGELPADAATIRGDPDGLGLLRRELRDLIRDPLVQAERLSAIVSGIIAWIDRSSAPRRRGGSTVRPITRRVALRVRGFLEEHYPRTVRMEEVCRHAGVGIRTMQRCFREYFQTTPLRYLKTLRLENAHRHLIRAHSATDSVTAVALAHGNRHLGRFSVEYRAMFGESPHETLRGSGQAPRG